MHAGMTTIGELISVLFDQYEEQFHDENLAAKATQIVVDEILRDQQRPPKERRAARS